MKIAGIILATLMLIGAVFVGGLGVSKSLDVAKTIAGVSDTLSDSQMEAAGLPSAMRLKLGGVAGGLAALSCVGLFGALFFRKEKIPLVALAALGFSVVAIVVYPGIETGPLDGMGPKTQAMVTMGFTVLGAAGAMLVSKAAKNKV